MIFLERRIMNLKAVGSFDTSVTTHKFQVTRRHILDNLNIPC
jgi:hypothetical protein